MGVMSLNWCRIMNALFLNYRKVTEMGNSGVPNALPDLQAQKACRSTNLYSTKEVERNEK